MVHDDRGHFIGDAHWQAEAHLDTGDEFELDRGAAIVQVSDCTGQREQDLSELLDKRAREVEKRRATAVSRTPRPSVGVAGSSSAQDQSAHFQLRHRPLSDMLGTPSRIGRAAISPHSPYEARRMAQRTDQGDESRPAKRRKQEESPPSKSYHARALFGATLTLAPLPQSSRPSQGQIRHNWANTELKSLFGREKHQPPLSSDEQSDAVIHQSEEIVKIASSQSSPPPLPHKLPRPISTRLDNVNRSTTKPLEPTCQNYQQKASSDDVRTENSSRKPAVPRIDNKSRSKPILATRTSQLTRQEKPRNVIVVEHVQSGDSKGPIKRGFNGATRDAKRLADETTKEVEVVREVKDVLPSGHIPPRPINEQRTELRIRSRQRRGLLMISEKQNTGPGPKRNTTASDAAMQSGPNLDHPKQGGQTPTAEEPSLKPRQSLTGLASSTGEQQNEAVIIATLTHTPILEDNAPKEVSNDATRSNVLESSPHSEPNLPEPQQPTPHEDVDPSDVDDPPVRPRASRRLAERKSETRKGTIPDFSSEDESENMELSAVPKRVRKTQTASAGSSAPRITKMARKSIKSKEIIGFVVPNEDSKFKCPPFAAPRGPISTVGHASSKTANVDEADLESHTRKVQQPPVQSIELTSVAQSGPQDGSDDKSVTRPTPRLCNPATRGKKAAKKEDAAGQLPQTMVQLEPVAPTRVGAPKAPSSRKSSALTGFTKANGGTWSVHAGDLLGMTRPANKPSQPR